MPFVTCPKCRQESVAPRELIGLEYTCAKCGASFEVDEDGERPSNRSARQKRTRSRKSSLPWAVFLAVAVLLIGGIGLGIVLVRQAMRQDAQTAPSDSAAKPVTPRPGPERTSTTESGAKAQDRDAFIAKLKQLVATSGASKGPRVESYDKHNDGVIAWVIVSFEPVLLTDKITGKTATYTRAKLTTNPPHEYGEVYWARVELLP